MPGGKQPCPTVAACWSPAMPRMRIGAAEQLRHGDAEFAGAIAHLRQQRHAARRTTCTGRRPSAPLPMSNSSVRAALVASVACTLPPVSRHSRKLSMVPKASLPGLRRRRARRSHCRAARRSCWRRNTDRAAARSWRRSPARARARAALAQRRGAAVLPDDGVVDRLAGGAVPDTRGLALIGDADAGDVARPRAAPWPCASRTVATIARQISSGSCSTQPGAG